MHTHVHTRTCTHTVLPNIDHFTITQDGHQVTAVHVDSSLTLECAVYGYPRVGIDIVGPAGYHESRYLVEPSQSWNLVKKRVTIERAAEGLSGTYRCEGTIELTQEGETITQVSTEERELVVYSKSLIV